MRPNTRGCWPDVPGRRSRFAPRADVFRATRILVRLLSRTHRVDWATQQRQVHASRAALPQLPAVLWRPDRSLVGTWITTTATSWLVYRLTGSALLLGFVGFAGQIPAFLLGAVRGRARRSAGSASRCSSARRRSRCCSRFALAALTLGGHITVPLHPRAQHRAGDRQRIRHAGAAGVPHRDDRGSEGSAECDRAELVDGERPGCSVRRLRAS